MRRPPGHVDDAVVDERDLVAGAPEEPQPVVGAVAVGRVVRGAVEQARGHGDARVLLHVRDEVLPPDVLHVDTISV